MKTWGLMTLSLSSLLLAGTAAAQTPAAPRATSSAEQLAANEVGAVVVTARRREELLQNVPVAVTALSGTQLEQQGVAKLEDLTRVAPGFAISATPYGNAAPSPTVRSQRQPLTNLSYDPSVNIYFAEVVEERAHGLNSAMYDLSSVQVIKGPVGTLFGRNATGGALLITPQAPSSDFGGYIRGGIGNFALRQLEGAVNLPVNDQIAFRLSGHVVGRTGDMKSITTGLKFDDEHTENWRASMRWDITPQITNRLVVDGGRDRSAGTPTKLVHVYPGSLVARTFNLQNELDRLNASHFWSTGTRLNNDGERVLTTTVSNITEWKLNDSMTLKNILGYHRVRSYLKNDFDGASIPGIATNESLKDTQRTEELQLLGTVLDGSLDYIVGGYLFTEEGTNNQVTNTLGTDSITAAHLKNNSKSIFAQVTYKLPFAPQVSLTAGGRETKDKRYLDTSAIRMLAVPTCLIVTADAGGVPVSPCEKKADVSFSKFTYNLSLDWKVNENNLLYVATRRGYRSGGFTWTAKIPSEFKPFRPETVTDVELGLKSTYRLLDGPARTNIAVYRQKYKEIQRNTTFFTPGPNGVPFVQSQIINAASATIKGVEIEQTWRPVEQLDLSVSYAYSKPEFDKFVIQGPTGPIDYTGSRFSGAPKHMVAAYARLELPMPETAGRLFAQLTGAYQSDIVTQDVVSYDPVAKITYPWAIIKSRTTGDARIDWQGIYGSRVDASLWVKNFTNEKYYTGGADIQALGVVAYLPGRPRTIGLDLNYQF